MSAPLTIRAFARLDGCDESLVRRAIRTGRLTADEAGRLDPALAGGAWRSRPNDRTRCPTCGQRTDDPPGKSDTQPGTLDAERARLTAAKAEAAERANARERGELIERAVIDSAMRMTIGRIVTRLEMLGAEIAGNDFRMRRRIEAAVKDALEDLTASTEAQLLTHDTIQEGDDDEQ